MRIFWQGQKDLEPARSPEARCTSLLDGYAPSFCKQNRKRRRGSRHFVPLAVISRHPLPINEKYRTAIRLSDIFDSPLQNRSISQVFRNRSMVFGRWVDLSLGDDGMSVLPAIFRGATPCMQTELCKLYFPII